MLIYDYLPYLSTFENTVKSGKNSNIVFVSGKIAELSVALTTPT
jgi:hypothetical protein